MKIKQYAIIVACVFVTLLSACGQSGRLYLPEKPVVTARMNGEEAKKLNSTSE